MKDKEFMQERSITGAACDPAKTAGLPGYNIVNQLFMLNHFRNWGFEAPASRCFVVSVKEESSTLMLTEESSGHPHSRV